MKSIDSYSQIQAPAASVKKLLDASLSANTRRAYASRIKMFAGWCATVDETLDVPTSPGLVAHYIASMADAGKSIATIEQTVAAISFFHRVKGAKDTTKNELVRRTLKGAKRTIGTAQVKKQPLRIPALKTIIAGIDRRAATGRRDAALILLGFAGAFRRSELVALDVADFCPVVGADGRPAYEVTVRRSKTDQEASGMIKGIFSAEDRDICPVEALREYVSFCNIKNGPLFVQIRKGGKILNNERLSDQAVARILQNRAKNAGVELDLAGHSLRSGFITSAAAAGKSERSIQNQTGHKSIVTLRGYIQRVDALQDNAAAGLL